MCAEMEIKMEIQLWKEILEPYGQAVDELVVKFNHIKREYQNGRMYSPIESVSGRVKSISSIMEKAQRKNVKIEEIEEKIEDIAGIRIICQFVEDINTVVKIIKKRGTLRSNRKRIISQTVNRAVTGVIMLSHIIRFRLYTVLKSLKWKFR